MSVFGPRIDASIARQQDQLLRAGQANVFSKIRQRTFYSAYLFRPGIGGQIASGRYEVFAAAKGDIGQGFMDGLTARETNWLAARRVPDQQNLLVRGIGVEIRRPSPSQSSYPAGLVFGAANSNVNIDVPVHAADVAAVAYGMILRMKYLTQDVPIGLVADFPAVGGAYGFNESARQITAADPGPPIVTYSATPVNDPVYPFLPVTKNTTTWAFKRRLQVPLMLAAKDSFSIDLHAPRTITLLGNNGSASAIASQGYTGALEVVVHLYAVESTTGN